jgi:hypothetical protein
MSKRRRTPLPPDPRMPVLDAMFRIIDRGTPKDPKTARMEIETNRQHGQSRRYLGRPDRRAKR